MSGRVDGKVAFITGAARGQGRSHVDLADIASLVKELGRRVTTTQADVRDFSAMTAAVQTAVAEHGKIDIVCSNAGIAGHRSDSGTVDVVRRERRGSRRHVEHRQRGVAAIVQDACLHRLPRLLARDGQRDGHPAADPGRARCETGPGAGRGMSADSAPMISTSPATSNSTATQRNWSGTPPGTSWAERGRAGRNRPARADDRPLTAGLGRVRPQAGR
jgi:NAD(P)-dependent dehydrogenase (short-subunit alcohol dehydrogenase family)